MNLRPDVVLVTVVLAGCAAAGLHGPTLDLDAGTASPGIPVELQACDVAPPGVPPPPKPRTFDAIVDWANKTEENREKTFKALENCRARLVKLNDLIRNTMIARN